MGGGAKNARKEKEERARESFALGLKEYGGLNGRRDKEAAEKYFSEAASGGVKEADYWLARCLLDKEPPDLAGAEKRLKRAVRHGDGDAARTLGLLYSERKSHYEGESRNRKAAAAFKKGAAFGDGGSMYYLALAFRFGRGVKKDEAKAAALLDSAAEKGETRAKVELARAYLFGLGREAAPERAVGLLEELALSDLKAAVLKARALLEIEAAAAKKEGREMNAQVVSHAVEEYLRAAEGGDGDGLYFLAQCYREGIGVKKNAKKALAFALEAARGGDESAAVLSAALVGAVYENGEGVKTDLEIARRAYAAAAAGGLDCKSDLDRVKRKLDNSD